MVKVIASGIFMGIFVTLGLFLGMVKVSDADAFVGILVTSGLFPGMMNFLVSGSKKE